MPLYANAIEVIRANLEEIAKGNRVKGVGIGTLTSRQLDDINRVRAAHRPQLPNVIAEVLFHGSHIYKSRVLRDGYTIDDVIDQIVSALDEAAVLVPNPAMTVLHNRTGRADRYGNTVKDLAILECTARHPRPEIFSVVPKEDFIKPKK